MDFLKWLGGKKEMISLWKPSQTESSYEKLKKQFEELQEQFRLLEAELNRLDD